MWLGVGPKGTNKTIAPMGLVLFCQLLTSPKVPLIIFNCLFRSLSLGHKLLEDLLFGYSYSNNRQDKSIILNGRD